MSEGNAGAVASQPRAPLGGLEGALKRYRVMVLIVGTGLAILFFIGIPLQVIGNNKWPWTSVVEIVGVAHGIFYMVYLVTCLDLAGRARFRLEQLLGMVCSGFLPLLAFYMERKVVKRVTAQLALGPDAPPAPAAVLWAFLTGRRQRAGGRPRSQALDAAEPAGARRAGTELTGTELTGTELTGTEAAGVEAASAGTMTAATGPETPAEP